MVGWLCGGRVSEQGDEDEGINDTVLIPSYFLFWRVDRERGSGG